MSDGKRFILFRLIFLTVQMPVGVFQPFFALYLRNDLRFSARDVSYLVGISGITIILFQQAWGYLADIHVSKKLLILANSVLSALLFLVVGKLTHFWAIAGVLFVVQTLNTPTIQLLHGFLFTHEGSESRFGVLRAYGSLGFISTNVLLAIIADVVTGGKLWFIFPAWAITSLAAAAFIIPIPEHRTLTPARLTFVEVQRFFLGRREVALFLVVVLFYQSAHSLSYILQSFLMIDMKADMRLISSSYSLAALLEIPVFFAANRLIARYGEVKLIALAAGVQALRWMLIWGANTPGQIIAISVLHCITFGIFYAAAVSYINKHAGPHLKASGQTLFALVFFGFATVFGNYVGGQVTAGGWLAAPMQSLVSFLGLPDRGALHNLYLFSSMLAGVSLILALVLISWERRLKHSHVLGSGGQ